MPFNIWCGSNAEDPDPNVKGCRKHIGIGVRYNAEKTRVAMYYTTPVYQFKMRCHMCSNPITIKTDPGNMDYIVVSGGRRVEQRWDPSGNGQLVPESKSVGRKLADDAMFKLEHESGDKGKSEQEEGPRLGRMFAIADRVKDDYLANSILRQKFRKAKKERLEAAAEVNQLKAKAGIDIDIVAERETDIKMARLLSLQAHCDAEDVQLSLRDGIEDRDRHQDGQTPQLTSSLRCGGCAIVIEGRYRGQRHFCERWKNCNEQKGGCSSCPTESCQLQTEDDGEGERFWGASEKVAEKRIRRPIDRALQISLTRFSFLHVISFFSNVTHIFPAPCKHINSITSLPFSDR